MLQGSTPVGSRFGPCLSAATNQLRPVSVPLPASLGQAGLHSVDHRDQAPSDLLLRLQLLSP